MTLEIVLLNSHTDRLFEMPQIDCISAFNFKIAKNESLCTYDSPPLLLWIGTGTIVRGGTIVEI